jgi:hypothetical protein
MKEKLLEYAKRGCMTKAEVAAVLNCPVSYIGGLVRRKVIQPIPHVRPHKFDPQHLIDVLCAEPKQLRSLTSEKRKPSGNLPKGGFRKCL